MSDESETIALLREIRDLQKAHFERYKEFAAAAMQRQNESAEYRKKLAESSAAAREASAKHQMEVQKNFAQIRASSRRTRLFLWIFFGGLIFIIYGGQFLLAFFARRAP